MKNFVEKKYLIEEDDENSHIEYLNKKTKRYEKLEEKLIPLKGTKKKFSRTACNCTKVKMEKKNIFIREVDFQDLEINIECEKENNIIEIHSSDNENNNFIIKNTHDLKASTNSFKNKFNRQNKRLGKNEMKFELNKVENTFKVNNYLKLKRNSRARGIDHPTISKGRTLSKAKNINLKKTESTVKSINNSKGLNLKENKKTYRNSSAFDEEKSIRLFNSLINNSNLEEKNLLESRDKKKLSQSDNKNISRY